MKRLDERKKILVELISSEFYVPMKLKELAIFLDVAKEDRKDLEYVLNELISEGKISLTRKNKYVKSSVNAKTGTFIATTRGFGFVSIEDEEDVFIAPSDTFGAFPDDKVQIAITRNSDSDRKREGKVIKIVERGIKDVVGYYQKNKSFGFVVPDNQKVPYDIFVPGEKSNGAVTGHKVVVRITDYGGENHKPEGKVIEIIGHVNDPGTDIMSIVKSHELPVAFPNEVMKSTDAIPDKVSSEEMIGREDIRNWQTVTIDGEDAKDLDDAITLVKETDRYILGVHIADVTHYIQEDSPLDKEALKRGTSVYLVDRVIPMIPHKLSNGICSLNQGEDRLALSCIMEIDFSGNIIAHRISETLINVDRRMSYTAVKEILEDKNEVVRQEYQGFIVMFESMKELADILRKSRSDRGSIDFDLPETKIILDENGNPVEIKPYERNSATKIIEDFMLAANETVAEYFFWQELPFVYRSHEKPDGEKIQTLAAFINNFGYSIKLNEDSVHPKELQKLLSKIEGSPEELLISRLTLRSMKQARYTTTGDGHFGLAAKYYCHFTSPIRRYPDLQIHRIIKENLQGKLGKNRIAHYNNILPKVAEQASKTERRAEEAERDTIKLKKVEYMKQRIGKEYEGVISGVTSYGFYVELANTVEGMVHVNSLTDDYYNYSEMDYELVGEKTGRRYKLGHKCKVVVTGADKIQRIIDFAVAME